MIKEFHPNKKFMFISGFLGITSMLFLSLHKSLHLLFALLSLTAGSAGVAIADVTVDACVAQNSNTHPSLAADMQSLCALSASVGALLGFVISGVLVHLLGSKVSSNVSLHHFEGRFVSTLSKFFQLFQTI